MSETELVLTSGPELDNLTSFAATATAEDHLLVVAFESSADEAYNVVRAEVDEGPADVGVVSVGETTRSGAADSAAIRRSTPRVATMAGLDDLSRLATVVDLYLREWDAADGTIRVCFGSFTEVVARATPSAVIRFLHVVTSHLRDADAAASFYLHPRALDGHPAEALGLLFDGVTDEAAGRSRAWADLTTALPDGVAAVLEDAPRRRRVLRHLRGRDAPISTRALAECLVEDWAALGEGAADAPGVDRLHRELHHIHIPQLAVAGLVITDEEQTVVEATEATDRVASLLPDPSD